MLLLSHYKFCTVLAALLLGMFVLRTVTCEFHAPAHAHVQQPSSGSSQSPTNVAPDDGACLMAVLPATSYFPMLLDVMLIVMLSSLTPLTRVFLLFKPPKCLSI